MIITVLDLFLAGSETTGMVICWTILFLTLNQEPQRKLKREILEARSHLESLIPMEIAAK